MQSFVSRHQHQIQGTLSGFDRLRFVGSLLRLSYVNGLAGFLAGTGVLLKEFGEYLLGLSRRRVGRHLLRIPQWLLDGTPRPSQGRYTFTTFDFFDEDSPLLESGLLGPVQIEAEEQVVVAR